MKYIRTKDRIFESNEYLLSSEDLQSVAVCKGLGINPYKDVKIADTIEELCDEFVVIRDNQRPIPLTNLEQVRLNRGNYGYSNSKVYGAIWTDKGLIYVAKMNDKGELELI